MNDFPTGASVLDRTQALELLTRKNVGRLVVSVCGTVEIFPVNYVVTDSGNVLFRTGPGSKLASTVIAGEVAFEVDDVSDDVAWSVIVRGPAWLRTDSSALSVTDALDLHPFIDEGKFEVVEVQADQISARAFAKTYA